MSTTCNTCQTKTISCGSGYLIVLVIYILLAIIRAILNVLIYKHISALLAAGFEVEAG